MIWLACAAALVACGRLGGGEEAAPRGALQIRFEDKPDPEAFALEGEAVRDAPKGADGLWAAVAGLPRPERALVVNRSNGRKVVVALFAAPKGAANGIRLSNAAADALAMGDAPAEVKMTALRREPEIRTTRGRF
jgi:hypothetical protein